MPRAAVYTTAGGEALDWICWKHYGREGVLGAVLDANPGLADLGPVFPRGTRITLPELAASTTTPTAVRLWT